jgi:hypothetical protein
MHSRFIPRTLLIVAATLLCGSASAQIVVDTARGLVGEEVRLALRATSAIDSIDRFTLRGSFHLGNATVFYPERFVAGPRTSVESFSLVKHTDSTYDFEVAITPSGGRIAAGDTLCLLAGEALAGYDSVCVVSFAALRANDGPESEATGVVVTRSIGTPLPYVRYATLEPGYPNPVARYETVTWAFRIDKGSNVRFEIYNLVGERIAMHDRGALAPGIYTESFEVGFDVATGIYLIGMSTNSGNAYQYFHVVK